MIGVPESSLELDSQKPESNKSQVSEQTRSEKPFLTLEYPLNSADTLLLRPGVVIQNYPMEPVIKGYKRELSGGVESGEGAEKQMVLEAIRECVVPLRIESLEEDSQERLINMRVSFSVAEIKSVVSPGSADMVRNDRFRLAQQHPEERMTITLPVNSLFKR